MIVAFLPWVQSVVQRAPGERSLPARLLKRYGGNHISWGQPSFGFFWGDMMTAMPSMYVQPKSNHEKSITNYIICLSWVMITCACLEFFLRWWMLCKGSAETQGYLKVVVTLDLQPRQWSEEVPKPKSFLTFADMNNKAHCIIIFVYIIYYIICQKANKLILVSKYCTIWKCLSSKYLPNSKRTEMPRTTPPVRSHLCPPRWRTWTWAPEYERL